MADPIPSSQSTPIPAFPGNNLRTKLYELLLPEVQREDQQNASQGFVDAWDYPDAGPGFEAWDDPDALWDRVGLKPVIQRLFWADEKLEGDDLDALAQLQTILDPDLAPVDFLRLMAESFGHKLDTSLPAVQQRKIVRGLLDLYRSRGTTLSWKVFFRMVDLKVQVYPLWKTSLEASTSEDYSREQFDGAQVTGEVVGPAGLKFYADSLHEPPVRPGTVIFNDGDETYREVDPGVLLGSNGGVGVIDYLTGKFELTKAFLAPVAPSQVTANYEHVDEEFPYHAARVDFEVFLVPVSLTTENEQDCNQTPDTNENLIVDDGFLNRVNKLIAEVRPIHVLIRNLSFVVELDEELCNPVTDANECGPTTAIDDRHDWVVDPNTQFYNLESVPVDACDDELDIYEDAPGTGSSSGGVNPGTTEATLVFPDECIPVCPLDVLVVEQVGISEEYW